jgi:hypothetical protein
VLFWSTKKTESRTIKKSGTLIIGSNTIVNDSTVIYSNKKHLYAQLPLLVVLKETGFDIRSESTDIVLMTYKEKKYVLDFNLKTLCEDGKNYNLLDPPPGSTTYICIFEANDVLIDTCTLRSLFFLLDVPFYIDIDYDRQTITVTSASIRTVD